MTNALTWLHISDIHFFPKNEWRDNEKRSSLIDFLVSTFEAEPSLKPDLILCTGDIGFGATKAHSLKDQYAQAAMFFDSLLTTCGLSKQRLFVVPGNHDVNRMAINSDSQRGLLSLAKTEADGGDNEINRRFEERDLTFQDSMKRLHEYEKFVAEYAPHQVDPNGRACYARSIDINDRAIGIAGFNSAWTCSGEEDDRNIWLAARWQFAYAHNLLKDADVRVGLIHHPADWLSVIDRRTTTRRIASDFDFWLHGHTHDAWITASEACITIAAGAIGAATSEEFGFNITQLEFSKQEATTRLFSSVLADRGWVPSAIAQQAPNGVWSYLFPRRLQATLASPNANAPAESSASFDLSTARILQARFDEVRRSFPTHPLVWVEPRLHTTSDGSKEENDDAGDPIRSDDIISNPGNIIINAPPQHGLSSLGRYMALEAWKAKGRLWLYIDAKKVKPHIGAVETLVSSELQELGCPESNVECVVLDSMLLGENDHQKLLRTIHKRFPTLPLILLQTNAQGSLRLGANHAPVRAFRNLFIRSLSRESVRAIVASCNDRTNLGVEDVVVERLLADLEVLNLHRTPLNCLTLLKVFEHDFDESPVNRTEIIHRVLFLLFNVDQVPSYKIRPDLKDCEFVLGYFCEKLIRSDSFEFTREKFLSELKLCCRESYIDLDTDVVFDILQRNYVFVQIGGFFEFRFAYWLMYFAAQRMHQFEPFKQFMFADGRYANYPEIMEFYTGIDRRSSDALQVLTRDLRTALKVVLERSGLKMGLNPYQHLHWEATEQGRDMMRREMATGVLQSNLPASVKDQYADRGYDSSRAYNQNVSFSTTDDSFCQVMWTLESAARALRNSDYVDPEIKKELLVEIFNGWEQVSMILLVVLPALAKQGIAIHEGVAFVLLGDFGESFEEKVSSIGAQIPSNVVRIHEDGLYSQKMAPLVLDFLARDDISDLVKHEAIILLLRKRPRGWHKAVESYIARVSSDSFYLLNVQKILRHQYRYGFMSEANFDETERLIKTTATKHLTGARLPGLKALTKVKFGEGLIPPREGVKE